MGYETSLVFQIYRWAILDDQSRRLQIASAFARPGIPGYIFLEGRREDSREVVANLVTIFSTDPYLVPLEQRVALLMPRDPSSCPIKEGQWVRCLHGLYRDDIGFVCEHNPLSDLDMVVAFVARIPEESTRSAKRKRAARPEPRTWSLLEVEAVWGSSRVQKNSTEEFVFCLERYCSGLIMKHITSRSLATVANAPNDIRPFIRAKCIRNIPSFTPWARRFAQDNIQPQQRVRIETGEQKGVIGRPYTISNSVATIVLETEGNTLLIDTPLRSLAPLYVRGDGVKDRWSDSHGIVISTDEDHQTLVYVEKDSMNEVSLTLSRPYVTLTHSEITTPMDAMEIFDPPHRYYHFKEGDWVEFRQPRDPRHRTRRGYVRAVEDTHALVIDEHTLAEVSDVMSSQ